MNDNALKLTAKPEEGPGTTTSVNTTGYSLSQSADIELPTEDDCWISMFSF